MALRHHLLRLVYYQNPCNQKLIFERKALSGAEDEMDDG
jgi:hypothetical protein